MASFSNSQGGERTTWPNKLEYHLSMFSYVLGFVSFWRFPYLAFDNGGAPFVYVFIFLHIVVGIPFIFLEMAWGQYGNLAPLQVFKTVPAMMGIGVCMLIISSLLILYFGVVSYYFLVYLASSFSHSSPWTACDNIWNTADCQISPPEISCGSSDSTATILPCNITAFAYSTPAVEFWKENLLRNASVCTDFGAMTEILVGSESNALVSPIIIMACFLAGRLIISNIGLANHVRFTGKIAYLLSTVPFAVIVLLLVRCVTLNGSMHGLKFLYYPGDYQLFLSPKIWKDACGQVFLSIMASSGGLITWSSYNRFYNKYHVDASLLIVIVPFLSLLSAVSVFAVAGHISSVTGVSVAQAFMEVEGPFAALIAYSQALSQMWGDIVSWSIAVFSTLYLSSTIAMFPSLECVLSCLSDTVPIFRRLPFRNLALFLVLVVSACAYYGVPCFLNDTGLQIISFFDTFALPMSLMLIGLTEMLMLCYAFGLKLLYTNTKAMTGSSCLRSHFWTFVWGFFTPLIVTACLAFTVYGLVTSGPSSLGYNHIPDDMSSVWGDIAGGVLVGFIFIVLLVVAVIKVAQAPGSCAEKFRHAFTPKHERLSGNGGGSVSHTNGDLFMSNYATHREPALEILIDEDIVTTV